MSWLNQKEYIHPNDSICGVPSWQDLIDIYDGNRGSNANEDDFREFFKEQINFMINEAEENLDLVIDEIIKRINS